MEKFTTRSGIDVFIFDNPAELELQRYHYFRLYNTLVTYGLSNAKNLTLELIDYINKDAKENAITGLVNLYQALNIREGNVNLHQYALASLIHKIGEKTYEVKYETDLDEIYQDLMSSGMTQLDCQELVKKKTNKYLEH